MDRNTILFIVLTAAVLIGWDLLVIAPQREAMREQQRIEEAAREAAGPAVTGDIAGAAAEKTVSIEEALAKSPGRVKIETPSLSGSINLAGGRIDDLLLKNYRETLDLKSPMIRLLTPSEAEHGHYIEQGFVAASGSATQLTESLTWSAPAGSVLTPQTPVTLRGQRRLTAMLAYKPIQPVT